MYHVYCDKGDPPPFLCEGDDRHLVAKYIYGGRCEQCKDRAWVEEGEERECHLQDQLEDLRVECLPKDQEKKYHENIVKKHNIQERFAEDKLENESDDIDFTVEWVKEHLNAVWTGNEKALKRLGYMQACDMKVRLNKELKKPEGLQKKSKPRNTPIPTGWQKIAVESWGGFGTG
ncbi:hypothetical protein UCRPA7_8395 [Phaeoacremonium minimum UCRPA7]|uniref:Uncharacterized protein n=1 Tax=Phaeoacremonium minimum (strain UCR-PA7) TaxID=1286976 RepID=R8BA14_PHAM7|nr:hypothetical protein UCRPA7_8395 [Phaeoacremonium minimum UCRPA7]EON96165.1 hypothetical protein UCRPA7_8395 [Phaeoacremonium minimum UCRPA7]